ncbi:MAG: hypothetical protein EOP07_03030 [Proteobacteria bacterium]|nr:MAG: hypothetical protein EOP07_03030 [Pseudomonadota bacterium]
MNQQVINLDKENVLIIVSHNGFTYALDKTKLIELLELKIVSPKTVRTLASVGKLIGVLAAKENLGDYEKSLIVSALSSFDGHIPSGTTSQVGHALRELCKRKETHDGTAKAIKLFLGQYPQLESVSKRMLRNKKDKP